MAFAELGIGAALVRNLERMGYREPRPIQARAIAPILAGRDVLALAPTGTGKTAAFAAPIGHLLHARQAAKPKRQWRKPPVGRHPRAVFFCPTRELAQQVAAETTSIVRGTGLRVLSVYGKVNIRPQVEALARGVDVVVATPGRARDLIAADAMITDSVRFIVIDEADRMMDMGFRPQIDRLLAAMPDARQTVLFTATMPENVAHLTSRFLSDPVRIEIGEHTRVAEHLQQRLICVHNRDKVPLLLRLIAERPRGGIIVFCRTRRRVGWVGTALRRNGVTAVDFHGDRSQAQRQRGIERFAKGELAVLVATDVAGRGLHLPAARTVVNYDLPYDPEEYVHRVGRAGHGGGSGEALTLLARVDEPLWDRIVDATGTALIVETIEGFEPKQRADAARAHAGEPRRSGARRGGKRTKQDSDRGPVYRRTKSAKRGTPGRGRSRKNRPIAPGELPGTGVKGRVTDRPRSP